MATNLSFAEHAVDQYKRHEQRLLSDRNRSSIESMASLVNRLPINDAPDREAWSLSRDENNPWCEIYIGAAVALRTVRDEEVVVSMPAKNGKVVEQRVPMQKVSVVTLGEAIAKLHAQMPVDR